MHFTFIAETDIGTTKDTNQDSILVKHGQYSGGEVLMAIVCDGMGGLSKGELPHLIGAITNIDGNEIQRSLKSIKAELMKRPKSFCECRR